MRYAFGDIEVDTTQIRLVKDAVLVECEPKVFTLLVYFCQHPEKAISRAELVENVWGGRVVSDAAVNRAVGELRKLLEDNLSSPKWIKTVSKVGYQLTVTPVEVGGPGYQDNKAYLGEVGESCESESSDESSNYHSSVGVNTTEKVIAGRSIFRFSKMIFILFCVFTLFILFQYFPLKGSQDRVEILSRQPVTSLMGSAFNPFYQAKSDTLVFLYKTDKESSAQPYIQEGEQEPKALIQDGYYYTDVIYSADGDLYASRLDNLEQRNCEVIRFDPESQISSVLFNCGERVVTQLDFDEQQRRLIYRSRPSISAPYAVYSFQVDTGRQEQLTHPLQKGNNLGDYYFSLSPDSKRLAVVEYSGEGLDHIKFIDLNDNRVLAQEPFIENVHGLLWRSSKGILAANGDGLYEYDVDEHKLVSVERSDQFGRLAHGREANTTLTERSQLTVNIFAFEKGEKVSALTESSGISRGAVFGHRSNIFAYTANRTGEAEIYIQPENGAGFSSDFIEPIEHLSALSWSNDDATLLASVNGALYLFSLADRSWRRVADSFSQIHHAAFSNGAVLFSAELAGMWNIWRLSLIDGELEQLTTLGGYSVQGDEHSIFFTKFNQAGLYQLHLDSGKESVLIEEFPIAGWRHWQLSQGKIYYLLGKEYREMELESGTVNLLYKFSGRAPLNCHMAYLNDFFACDQVELSRSNIWQLQLSKS